MDDGKNRKNAKATHIRISDYEKPSTFAQKSKDEFQDAERSDKKRRRADRNNAESRNGSGRAFDEQIRSKSSQKQSTPDEELDPADPEVKEILGFMETIREVLGRHYVDVISRLKLNWVPQCVDDQEYCRSRHHRKCPVPKVVDQMQSSLVGNFSKYNRRLHYLRAIQDMCIRSEFPGEEVMKTILELILISKQPPYVSYPSTPIVQQCILVAELIVMKFPPCWPDINRAYRGVLTGRMSAKKFDCRSTGADGECFFVFILSALKHIILAPERGPHAQANCSSDSDDDECTYEDWMKKTSVEENFWQHTRQEKLDRLFAVLNILAKILEYDMSIWLLRYISRTKEVNVADNASLVATLFFDGGYILMTDRVKKFLEIFVMCVRLGFPSSAIGVLTRLLNLLCVAVATSEKQHFEKVQYPNIGQKSDQLVKAIYKTIIDKFGREIQCFLLVIKAIQIPFVKYLLINELLLKMNPDKEEMNVKKVVLMFQRQRWCCMEGTRLIDSSPSEYKYPEMLPNKMQQQIKSNEIFAHEYLAILLDSLRAYCETYRIPEVFACALLKKPLAQESPKEYGKHRIRSGKLNIDAIENDIEELEEKLNRKTRFLPYKKKELWYNDLYVRKSTFTRYRDDIKYLGILKPRIRALYEKYPELFREWHEYMEDLLNQPILSSA